MIYYPKQFGIGASFNAPLRAVLLHSTYTAPTKSLIDTPDKERSRYMTTTARVELIPRSILFGNPVKTSPRISPDGKRMSYLAPVNGVLNVWVGTAGGDDYQPVTQDKERGIRFYTWSADNKHILYVQDSGGNENWHLYATNLETHETRDLTPFEN